MEKRCWLEAPVKGDPVSWQRLTLRNERSCLTLSVGRWDLLFDAFVLSGPLADQKALSPLAAMPYAAGRRHRVKLVSLGYFHAVAGKLPFLNNLELVLQGDTSVIVGVP